MGMLGGPRVSVPSAKTGIDVVASERVTMHVSMAVFIVLASFLRNPDLPREKMDPIESSKE
jgi:hypothetical protein